MGECRFCHKDAGFLKKEHDECRKKFDEACSSVSRTIEQCFSAKADFFLKADDVNAALSRGMVQGEDKDKLFVACLDKAVESYLSDNVINDSEYKMITRFVQFSGMPQAAINVNHSLDKVVQSQVLNEILNGKVPTQRFSIAGGLPFILGRDEIPVWIFRNVTLHEQKTVREMVGRNRGFNIRVAKGIYYRTGGFRGTPVETTSMQRVGVGMVCLTTKNVYFSSPEKSIKIPYEKIISVNTYSNGIDLQKEGAREKPIFLEGVDSWFCYNVIANLK